MVNAADYTVWRDNLGAMLGAGSRTAVPGPKSAVLMLAALVGAAISASGGRVFEPISLASPGTSR